MITTVTGKNQISIPAAIAAELGLRPGSRIDWQLAAEPDQLVCRVLPDPARVAADLKGAGRRYLREGRTHPLEALAAERSGDDQLRTEGLE